MRVLHERYGHQCSLSRAACEYDRKAVVEWFDRVGDKWTSVILDAYPFAKQDWRVATHVRVVNLRNAVLST